ncbi:MULTISPECIES: hypothetical protein [Sulfurimonas]|uniref:hypothetical protein n=1 Tax=Sulfurimonas TaxID=202746 RepID=UPI00125EEA29|nr:hypothetical protein [Sulfurimonas hydrogeniphila]
MADINWNEYKEYKRYTAKNDNFAILLDFIKSYYNMTNPFEIFEILVQDETAKMMLDKRNITDPEKLENFMFQN